MCTLVILRRPDHDWPLILAANRDEMAGRPWLPPDRHWPDREEVRAGIDELAGGTWLGLNDHGVAAGILNRRDSLGPDPDLRSRGEIVLEALDHADAVDAADALAGLNAYAYRSFNLIVADNRDTFWVRSLGSAGDGTVHVSAIGAGLHLITAHDLDDPNSPRIRRFGPKFEAADAPDPAAGDWSGWEALLADRSFEDGTGPAEAMCVITDTGFGTLSSSLIALPSIDLEETDPVYRFADGRPGEVDYRDVEA